MTDHSERVPAAWGTNLEPVPAAEVVPPPAAILRVSSFHCKRFAAIIAVRSVSRMRMGWNDCHARLRSMLGSSVKVTPSSSVKPSSA